MIRTLVQFNDPRLRMRSSDVADVHDPKIQQLIQDMAETMDKARGVGIAAVQVGENLRIFWVNYGHYRFAVINPHVELLSTREQKMEEGCLSYPGVWGDVVRVKKLVLTGVDPDGHEVRIVAKDYLARVIQHEYDHLQGKVIVDKFVS